MKSNVIYQKLLRPLLACTLPQPASQTNYKEREEQNTQTREQTDNKQEGEMLWRRREHQQPQRAEIKLRAGRKKEDNKS